MSDCIFIKITFDESRIDGATARALAAVCPVDIYAADSERLVVRPEQADECADAMAELCLTRAPAGALVIHKMYKDEPLVSRGAE